MRECCIERANRFPKFFCLIRALYFIATLTPRETLVRMRLAGGLVPLNEGDVKRRGMGATLD